MNKTSQQGSPPSENLNPQPQKRSLQISRQNTAPTIAMVGFLAIGAAMVVAFWDLIFYEDAEHSHILIGPPTLSSPLASPQQPALLQLQMAEQQLQPGSAFSELWMFPEPITVGPETSVQLFAIEPEVASAVGIESMKDDLIYTDAGNTPRMSLRVPKLSPADTPNTFQLGGYVDFAFRSLNVLKAESATGHMVASNARAFVTEATFFKIASAAFDMTADEFVAWQASPDGESHSLTRNCLATVEEFDDLREAKKALKIHGYEVFSW